MNRVVITGTGVVSPVGTGSDVFWRNLTAGKSGIGPVTLFDASSFPVRIGGEVKDLDVQSVIKEFPQSKGVQDRKVFLALAAGLEAIVDAHLPENALEEALLNVGVGLETIRLEDLAVYGCSKNPSNKTIGDLMNKLDGRLLQTPLDCATSLFGQGYGFQAGRFTNCSACVAGASAIGESWQMIKERHAQLALAGAADSMLNPIGLGGFGVLRVLSDENDRPTTACRPFDASRKGTVLGEGAAFVVLETLDSAKARNAKIYAEIIGYGSSMDAYSVSDPDDTGRGAAQSMASAIKTAGIEQGNVDCVNAHGTGTVKNDIVETAAIKQTLGRRAYEIPVHSVKSMTGHLIAASGAVEAVASVLTIFNRCVPPTINLTKPDDQCDLDYVPNVMRNFKGDTVLSNSFGFGGQNATLIFRRYA